MTTATLIQVNTLDNGVMQFRRSKLTAYQREMLTALYASLDYLTSNELPGQAELGAAIAALESQA
jgi:hypothetical protein